MDDGWSDDDLQESIRRLQGNVAEAAEMPSCKTAAPVATTADRSCQLQAVASVWDSVLKEFHNGLPMRLLRKRARGCQVRLKGGCDARSLARRGPRWMAKTKVDSAVFSPFLAGGVACSRGNPYLANGLSDLPTDLQLQR